MNKWTYQEPPEGKFQVGDVVRCAINGDGIVTEVEESLTTVSFDNETCTYDNGCYSTGDKYPILSFVSRRVKRYQVLYRLSGSREWHISALHFDSVASWRKTRATTLSVAEAKLLMESEVISAS